MEDPGQSKQTNVEAIGGTWREAIKVALETTKAAFPGGEVMAHLDHKLVIPKELISILTLTHNQSLPSCSL